MCSQLLNTTYKFYFSFENTLCDDYVTEKVFKNMKEFVIPVVFNGADMNRFLPPRSYINAESFSSVKDLADYLLYLSSNEIEFIKYFWWRKHYTIEPLYMPSLCDLCAKVDKFSSTGKTYRRKITDLFSPSQCRWPKFYL